MDRLSREAVDPKAALRELPPLVKGYLRLGASFGDGAVIDWQFGTTDVLVVLPVSAINQRYIDHFGPTAEPPRRLTGARPLACLPQRAQPLAIGRIAQARRRALA